jgi:hypothetical protein
MIAASKGPVFVLHDTTMLSYRRDDGRRSLDRKHT